MADSSQSTHSEFSPAAKVLLCAGVFMTLSAGILQHYINAADVEACASPPPPASPQSLIEKLTASEIRMVVTQENGAKPSPTKYPNYSIKQKGHPIRCPLPPHLHHLKQPAHLIFIRQTMQG